MKGRRNERGQVLAIVAILLVAFIGMLGLVIDVGHVYVEQRHLQTAVDASALAAAQDLPDGDQAETTADDYSGYPGSKNGFFESDLVVGNPTVTPKCLSVATAGVSCAVGTGGCQGPIGCNAVQVTQTVDVKPWFMGVLGFGSQTISASATATIAGGASKPLDIELVIDSTGSMDDDCTSAVDGIPSGLQTKLDCAKAGIRALLTSLYPCAVNLVSCPAADSTHNVAEPLDRIGLMTFPGITNRTNVPSDPAPFTDVPKETNCANDIGTGDVGYSGTPNYLIIPFSSDWRAADTAAVLNKDSPLVQSVWWKGCVGGVYPINGGGGAGSIVGGGTGDLSTATNVGAVGNGTTGGNPGDTSTAANGAGIGDGSAASPSPDEQGATNAIPIGGGPHSGSTGDRGSATNGPGIGGGANSASGNDRTKASGTATSLTVARPSNAVAGDFILASVTTKGNLTSNGNICAPTTGTWARIRQTMQSTGATMVTHASFWTTTDTSSTYKFTFTTGACGGAGVSVAATEVAVRYTGVDPEQPDRHVGGANRQRRHRHRPHGSPGHTQPSGRRDRAPLQHGIDARGRHRSLPVARLDRARLGNRRRARARCRGSDPNGYRDE